jgi:tetratricopeptide (TPR) repeat protein
MPVITTQTRIKLARIAFGLAGAGLALATAGARAPVSTNWPSQEPSVAAGKNGGSEPSRAAAANAESEAPVTPREFYNAGAQQLKAGKLREAEASLETTLASQQEPLQVPALYNLGHVRFGQGIEALKKGPAAAPTVDRGRAAEHQADEAIRQMDDALAGNDVQKLVAAYMRGRGARKELKSALEAVRKAMTVYGTALSRWQRSSGDFKSALELRSTDADSEHNAEVVDRCIAKLVDSLREMQACANAMGNKSGQLGDKLKQVKGRIPGKDMPPGAAGEDDEDEDMPLGPKPGQEEGPSKEGKEMTLSQEQAGWVLDGFKLDSERRLPMGQGELGQPKDRNRPTW